MTASVPVAAAPPNLAAVLSWSGLTRRAVSTVMSRTPPLPDPEPPPHLSHAPRRGRLRRRGRHGHRRSAPGGTDGGRAAYRPASRPACSPACRSTAPSAPGCPARSKPPGSSWPIGNGRTSRSSPPSRRSAAATASIRSATWTRGSPTWPIPGRGPIIRRRRFSAVSASWISRNASCPRSNASSPTDRWRNLLLVLHGAVNRMIFNYVMNLSWQARMSIEQDNCCINIIDVDTADGRQHRALPDPRRQPHRLRPQQVRHPPDLHGADGAADRGEPSAIDRAASVSGTGNGRRRRRPAA
jgi:hypothetical protein